MEKPRQVVRIVELLSTQIVNRGARTTSVALRLGQHYSHSLPEFVSRATLAYSKLVELFGSKFAQFFYPTRWWAHLNKKRQNDPLCSWSALRRVSHENRATSVVRLTNVVLQQLTQSVFLVHFIVADRTSCAVHSIHADCAFYCVQINLISQSF